MIRRNKNPSGFRGVTRNKKKFEVYLCGDGERIYVGCFDTAEDAAREYDLAARAKFGPHAVTNAALGLLPTDVGIRAITVADGVLITGVDFHTSPERRLK